MPVLNHIEGIDTTSLAPVAVAIKDGYYGIQALGDNEAYYRIQGCLALIAEASNILDADGNNMVKGAVDFVAKWKVLLRPLLVVPYLADPTLVDALEPSGAGDATAAEQQAGADFMRNTLPGLIQSGDDHNTISQYIAAYLYYMLGSGFVDKFIER